MRSVVTPSEEALPILSQIASSRLNNSREIALRGGSKEYWGFVRFYSVLGLLDSRLVSKFHDLVSRQAESEAMSYTDILSRASSINSDSVLNVSRPTNIVYPTELRSEAKQEIIKADLDGKGLPSVQ